MSHNIESSGSLFCKLILISINHCDSMQNTQKSRRKQLQIEVESHFDLCRKEVLIRLSDSNDPFFLFVTTINEQLFNKIKSSENLIIDFNSFPQKLIDLFETCFEEQNKDDSRFMLSIKEMNKDFIILEVIETNPFKHLIHISLKIAAANEEFIKSSFRQTFRNLKLENQRLEDRLHSMELLLNENSLSQAKQIETIENQYKLQIREEEIKFKKQIELEKHLINQLMAKESESKSLIETLRTELATAEDNLRREQRLKSENELQAITDFNNKMVLLEEKISETRDLYNTEKCERLKIEALCEEKEKLLDESNERNRLLTEDLSKANQIIRKLQTEVQSTHQKLSLLNKVATKQEEVVGVKQTTVQKLQSDLRLCSEQLRIKDKEYENLRRDFESLRDKCEESEAHLKTNQNVIGFLNKQISELQLKHGIKSNTESGQSVLPKVNLVERQTEKTNPKTVVQRNALFKGNDLRSDNLFKRKNLC